MQIIEKKNVFLQAETQKRQRLWMQQANLADR